MSEWDKNLLEDSNVTKMISDSRKRQAAVYLDKAEACMDVPTKKTRRNKAGITYVVDIDDYELSKARNEADKQRTLYVQKAIQILTGNDLEFADPEAEIQKHNQEFLGKGNTSKSNTTSGEGDNG
tara:strand:+ start:1022 stop:1396 length:375 start_codon:yes stop_codon:yes gene_type:complete